MCLITRHGPLDISFNPDGTTGYDSLAPAAVIRPIGNHPGVAIADLADIIHSKTAAGRAKDLAQLPRAPPPPDPAPPTHLSLQPRLPPGG